MGIERVDRDALHRFLYDRSNSRSQIKIHQITLADQLDVTRGTMYRVMKELTQTGRIRKIESLPRNVGIYQIVNPDEWVRRQADPAPPQPKRIMWG